MKTLTEFAGLSIKNAASQKQALTTAGKTPEELPQAMGEALKLEGDRLTYLMNALEAVGDRTQDLKRVVVFTLAEGEKAPHGAVQKGEQYYLVEHFPPLNKGPERQGKGRGERGGRGDKRGKGRGKGRGGRGGDRRGERGPRREGEAGAPASERKPRDPKEKQ